VPYFEWSYLSDRGARKEGSKLKLRLINRLISQFETTRVHPVAISQLGNPATPINAEVLLVKNGKVGPIWSLRFYRPNADGRRVENKAAVGCVFDLPTSRPRMMLGGKWIAEAC
jgi:hypothetical protein